MGSFNGNGPGQDPKRRRGPQGVRKRSVPSLESLELRTLLTGGPASTQPTWMPTSTDVADVKNGPLANAGTDLIRVYQQYQAYVHNGGKPENFKSSDPNLRIQNGMIGVDVRTYGDVNAFRNAVQNDARVGMIVTGTSQQFQLVEGWVPIANLVTLASYRQGAGAGTIQTVGIQANYVPKVNSQGKAANQAEQVFGLPTALQQFPGVNGSGVTVGVLSDSANRYQNGLADSIATGDLPPLSRINVLQDEPVGGNNTDEGRAMMEEIYDLAPGVNLAFNTAFGGVVGFSDGIKNLSRVAGAQVIVDDVSYANEPFYQIGPIEQAISDVVNQDNRIYFSSAANQADGGFESPFRSSTATIGGVSGTFMDFDPGSGVTNLLPITVDAAGSIIFQYDQPYFGVTSDVDILLIDANGNIVNTINSGLGGRDNNLATQAPYEFMGVPAAGSYSIAVLVNSGSAPARIQMREWGTDVTFSHQFGNNGGISYPTSTGHNAGIDTIGVGAVDYSVAPPFSTTTPVKNEDYSSFGPRVLEFDANGNRIGTQFLQRPQVSGVDNVNTTFFIPGNDTDGDGLPNFQGTSAAAPNLAALAALMRQISPQVSQSTVLTAMQNSTIPLNGTAKGTWDVQGGYGLVQALPAFTAVDKLRVTVSSVPNGSTQGSLIKELAFRFNKPVNPASLQPTDLQFTQLPPGVSVSVLNAFVPSDQPDVVVFQLLFTRTSGGKANGAYGYNLADAALASTDGKPLVRYTGTFNVQDTTPPTITSATYNDRIVKITFSEPVDPTTINNTNILVLRAGSSGVFNNATNVTVSNLPGARMAYDANSRTVTVDLSALPQTDLPSDRYAIVVEDAVRDLVGNRLDGEFATKSFPTGDGQEGGKFAWDLGFISLQPTQVLWEQMTPDTDTGIAGDGNTDNTRPWFIGQVSAAFPGTKAGLQVYVQFNGLHGGTFDLTQGANGRGIAANSHPDVVTTTDANGRFAFGAPLNLPDGFQTVRIIVVNQPDQPPIPGLSTLFDKTFRIDTTSPFFVAGNVQDGAKLSTLSGGVTLLAYDPPAPTDTNSPFAVPLQYQVPTLDPATATNISNYSLYNLGGDNKLGGTGAAADTDYSSYITGATFTDNTNRTTTKDWYRGFVNLSFAEGLPAGHYMLIARSPNLDPAFPGITDAAGNPLDGKPSQPGIQNFAITFDLQPVPTYITAVTARSPVPGGSGQVVENGPQSYFEVPQPGTTPRADAPPTQWYIDFSGPLATNVPDDFYNDKVLLIRSADTPTSPSDGDFGTDPSFTSGVGYTVVSGTTVTLKNSILGAQGPLDAGYKNRLVLDLPAGTTLAPDKYRLLIPNMVTPNGKDLRIYDLFGNQMDGEFLGNPTSSGGYETLLPTGQYRAGLSGDLVPGGSFETGYVVVPNGNVIFARPDYNDDPILTTDDPDGSRAKPFPVLAPEALPNAQNNGDLNSDANFNIGFNPNLDLNGDGHFDRSAFFAASKLSANGPVVVVALPALSGDTLHRTFVLQKPSQDPTKPTIPDGSASVPYNTMLVFQPGSILKMRDASLYVQNQGSAIQLRGSANNPVYVTSYNDDSIGGDTNRDGAPSSLGGAGANPNPGDFGGILLRNFDDSARPIPISPGPDDPTRTQVDGRTRLGISGADEALSLFNFGTIRYGGGSVPRGGGVGSVFRFDAITLFNTRPMITNMTIDGFANANGSGGPNGGSQGGISVDMDSLREDELARGPLVRRTTVQRTSLNGIYVRAEINGVIEPTDAISYTANPLGQGGTQNYTFDDPLPYIFVARMVVGQQFNHNTGLGESPMGDRVYVQPGMVLKFQRGAAIDLRTSRTLDRQPSMNVGDRTYINQWDANSNLAPSDPGFQAQHVGDAPVIFTSFFDDNATTAYINPNTGVATTIVPKVDSDNSNSNLPTPGNVPALARWGSISVQSGATFVMDEATMQYGGGTVNVQNGTIGQRDVLDFEGAGGQSLFGVTTGALGTRAYVTNNNFYDNLEAPIGITPNGLLAADPLRPLTSGNPFFRGNIMLRNNINGLEVLDPVGDLNVANLTVDSVWDDTDLTYVLRRTIRLSGAEGVLASMRPPSTLAPELKPAVVLTIQSSLPDTPLADGSRVAKPGESVLVKLLNDGRNPLGDGVNGQPASTIASSYNAGAGFLVGIDNGVDPTPDRLVDPGVMSQIRILGIGGNETTGQPRVPAIITSVRDDSVGRVIRGVRLNSAADPTYLANHGYTGSSPQAGDGGVIGFGGHSLSDYNLLDPRDGNLIDNADIRYITRIDIQGGGWVFSNNGAVGGTNGSKLGNQATADGFVEQYNTAKAMTISNSNLSSFSQVGVIAHPSGVGQIHVLLNPPAGTPILGRDTLIGQPVLLNMVNNTIANMPTGVRINADTQDNDREPTPYVGVFLNNTFYNDPEAIHTQAPNYDGRNSLAHVYFLAMDNIFANSTDVAVRTVGQAYGSQLLYNLYSGTPSHTDVQGTGGNAGPFDAQPITGNAGFRDAANGDFNLTVLSDAVDAALSEVKQSNWGLYLRPIADQRLDETGGVRNITGRSTSVGGITDVSRPGDIVTLPGLSPALRGYTDQFVPVLSTASGAISGPTAVGGETYSWLPVVGERDEAGYLRQDEPGRANVGFGSRPFFDIGAFEYRQLFPPHVVGVQAIVNGKAVNLFVPGGNGGVNQAPQAIQVKFDQRIDPSTLNSSTILLQASGGDGIFGNANNAQDRFIPLSGKLTYDPLTSTLTIALTNGGLTLASDLYRIVIRGSGDPVVRNEQGLPLDGESTVNGDPNGAQVQLPSGDGLPGGDFYDTFSLDTLPPQFVSGSIRLAPQSPPDPRPDDNITSNPLPTFTGRITDPSTFLPLSNHTVYVDFDMNGDGIYEIIAAGKATTDAQGFFTITPTSPLPASTGVSAGPDGILGTADDSGYSHARFFVQDQAGNWNTFESPASIASFVLDTKGPRVTGTDPLPNHQAATNGSTVAVAISVDENVETSTVNTSSIQVTRSGGDGVFGNGNDVTLAIDPNSLKFEYLRTPSGSMILRFNITGANVNDVYRVTLKGQASGGILDVAGNPLDGDGDGTPGGDYNLDFIVFNPANTHTIFVDQSSTSGSPDGTRNNAYKTINAGIAAAGLGDTVAVIGGTASTGSVVYRESVNMKSLIKLVSADPSSTDGNVVPGLALDTVIRPDAPTDGSRPISVMANNLVSVPSFQTEIRGFTIASSLAGDPVLGTIAPDSLGVYSINSDLLIDRNYIIDSQIGVAVVSQGNSRAAQIVNNGIIGNVMGMWINDFRGEVTGFQGNAGVNTVLNNTVALNTQGLVLNTDSSGPTMVDVVNNIFWQNADQTTFRNGSAITSNFANRMRVRYNLFSQNGPSSTSPADDTVNVGGGFSPALLTNLPDANGNLTGTVKFVNPIDPRPTSFSGPGNFYLAANYDLTNGATGAIDNALGSAAPSTDFRFRGRFDVPNVGFAGPADMGAFEFNGPGGVGPGTPGSSNPNPSPGPGGGTISTSSFSGGSGSTNGSGSADGGSANAVGMPVSGPATGAGVASAAATASSVTIAFSGNVDRGTVDATDLLLSGDGLDPTNPAHATSLSWVDDHTVRFNLDGSFRSTGTVLLDIPAGAVRNADGTVNPEFAQTVNAPAAAPTGAPTSTPTTTPTPTAPTPSSPAVAPVAAPVATAIPMPGYVVIPAPTGTQPTTPTPMSPRAKALAARQAAIAQRQAARASLLSRLASRLGRRQG
jgi:hypothetical protein